MRYLIACSMVFSLLFSVIPLPFEWRWWRPELMVLVVIYWVTYTPNQFGLFMAWLCGLLLDIVGLSLVGYHSVGLVIIACISHMTYQRVRSYALWQQMVLVLVLSVLYQLVCNWMSVLVDNKQIGIGLFLTNALITASLWPVLTIILGNIRLRFRLG